MHTAMQVKKHARLNNRLLAHLKPAAAPATAVALPLNMNDNVHSSALQKLCYTLTNVVHIRDPRSNDVHNAEDRLSLLMFMAVIVAIVASISVPVRMLVRVTMIVVMMSVAAATFGQPNPHSPDTCNAAQTLHLTESGSYAILNVVGQRKKKAHTRAFDERYCRGKDEDGDEARGYRVPAVPAGILGE